MITIPHHPVAFFHGTIGCLFHHLPYQLSHHLGAGFFPQVLSGTFSTAYKRIARCCWCLRPSDRNMSDCYWMLVSHQPIFLRTFPFFGMIAIKFRKSTGCLIFWGTSVFVFFSWHPNPNLPGRGKSARAPYLA